MEGIHFVLSLLQYHREPHAQHCVPSPGCSTSTVCWEHPQLSAGKRLFSCLGHHSEGSEEWQTMHLPSERQLTAIESGSRAWLHVRASHQGSTGQWVSA